MLGIKGSRDSGQRVAENIGSKTDSAGIFRIKGNAIGIDLAAKPHNNTGFAILNGMIARTMFLRGDDEIVDHTFRDKPSVMAIDAPLSLPKGRCCANDDCQCSRYGISRQADRLLLKKGIRGFWPLLPTMKPLTLRGLKLRETFEKHGFKVIEVFPSATQKILDIPTKKAGKEKLYRGLTDLGITLTTENPSNHELDAVTAALTGSCYLAGHYEAVGDKDEGQVLVPANPCYYEHN